jgi:hypothetical protein
MRTITTHTDVYKFNELSDDAKQTALESLYDINVDHEWWDWEFEGAKNVLLEITGFDLDRNRHCTGNFMEYAEDTANKIIAEHGEMCETYQTAQRFIDETRALLVKMPEKLDDEGYDENEYEREQAQEDLDGEFLRAILEDYSIILQKQCEYLQSEEAIIETIEANDYDFTVDGKLF